MVATQLAGTIEVDRAVVRAEVDTALSTFRWSEAYSDYLCGGPWKSCMLWAAGGRAGDGLTTHYDHSLASSVTEYGAQLPYLRGLIERHFDLEHLNFARFAVMTDSVTVLHRDLLELADIPADRRESHRVHLPLVTNDGALFTQDEQVYRMEVGDVWFFDASRVHGAAAFSREPRTHLILDFTEAAEESLTRLGSGASGTIPPERLVQRERLGEGERKSLVELASLVTPDNIREIFGIVIKTHYRKNGGSTFVWDTLDEIGRLSNDEEVRSTISDMHRFFLMKRSADEVRNR